VTDQNFHDRFGDIPDRAPEPAKDPPQEAKRGNQDPPQAA
jgi:hypothetical protein